MPAFFQQNYAKSSTEQKHIHDPHPPARADETRPGDSLIITAVCWAAMVAIGLAVVFVDNSDVIGWFK